MSVVFWQILIDGFAISSLYALGATGFALIFGVSGVLNLSHGALMVVAVVAAWELLLGFTFQIIAKLPSALATRFSRFTSGSRLCKSASSGATIDSTTWDGLPNRDS